jgi:hypothetical protein
LRPAKFNFQPHLYVEIRTPKSTSTGYFADQIRPLSSSAPQSIVNAKVIAKALRKKFKTERARVTAHGA